MIIAPADVSEEDSLIKIKKLFYSIMKLYNICDVINFCNYPIPEQKIEPPPDTDEWLLIENEKSPHLRTRAAMNTVPPINTGDFTNDMKRSA